MEENKEVRHVPINDDSNSSPDQVLETNTNPNSVALDTKDNKSDVSADEVLPSTVSAGGSIGSGHELKINPVSHDISDKESVLESSAKLNSSLETVNNPDANAGQPIGTIPTINSAQPIPVVPSISSNFGSFESNLDTVETSSPKPVTYVVALAVSLSLVLGIISSISGLLEITFNHIGANDSSDSSITSYVGNYELKMIVWLSASLVISGVIYVVLVRYLAKNNPEQLSSFGRKIYNLIYGGFLAILALATIASLTNFVYSCFVQFVPKESNSYSSMLSGGETAWWSGVLQAFCTTAVMTFVLFYYYKKLTTKV